MLRDIYFKIPRKIRIFIFSLLIILIFYFIGRFLLIKTKNIPGEFLTARQEASVVAQKIVSASSDSAERIKEISVLSNQEKYTDALNLIIEELDKNREIREEAITLSSYLETMTRATPKIYPDSSARTALEAVSVETTLISRLITYNDYLNQLLEVLREKLLGKGNSHEKITELVDKINNEAKSINDLNQKFNGLINGFDNNKN